MLIISMFCKININFLLFTLHLQEGQICFFVVMYTFIVLEPQVLSSIIRRVDIRPLYIRSCASSIVSIVSAHFEPCR